jgi:hypothetical protein
MYHFKNKMMGKSAPWWFRDLVRYLPAGEMRELSQDPNKVLLSKIYDDLK